MFQVVYALFGFGKPGIQNRIQNDAGFNYTQFGFRKPGIKNWIQNGPVLKMSQVYLAWIQKPKGSKNQIQNGPCFKYTT